MTINTYDLGDLVKVTGTFTDTAGTALDPSTVSFTYKDPAGTSTTLVYGDDDAVVKSSTGVYYVNINANIAGHWFWRWHSAGTGQAADNGQFYVEPSGI